MVYSFLSFFFSLSENVISYVTAGVFDIENPTLWSNWNEFSIFMDTFEKEKFIFLSTWLSFNSDQDWVFSLALLQQC